MKILIPEYLIESVLRHYAVLAKAYRYDGNNRAVNAKRVSDKEIKKIKLLMDKQRNEWKETSES